GGSAGPGCPKTAFARKCCRKERMSPDHKRARDRRSYPFAWGGGNRRQVSAAPVDARPFPAAEKERAVPDNGTSQHAAVLVLLQHRFRRARGREVVTRIERIVPQEFEHITAQPVAAGFDPRIDHGPRRVAVFRRV